MLVVVRSAEDAAVAIDGGADRLVIRLSSVDGAAGHAICNAVAHGAGSRLPISLLCPDGLPDDIATAVEGCRSEEVFAPLSSENTGSQNGIRFGVTLPFSGVVKEAAFEAAAGQGRAGVLFGEGVQPRRLLQVVTIGHLQQQVRWARSRQLAIGFAGTMEVPDIPRLLAIAPDFLVFDDTVRQQGLASGPINPERIRFVRELIPQVGADEPARIATTRGARVAALEEGSRDRIFVRDWTVSIHLGAYEYERMAQRVRFTVDVEIVRKVARATDIRDVVTYDLITDAISRATVDHVEVVETLAEDVAAAILAHPRVTSVDVTVEKLDLGPGSLGCRIVRGRPSAG